MQMPTPSPVGLKEKAQHKCSECSKQFPNQSSLSKHKAVHSNWRPHECPECLKRFKRLDHLSGHLTTHRGEKPHACTVPSCNKRYSDPRSLKRHMGKHHPQEAAEQALYMKAPARTARIEELESKQDLFSLSRPLGLQISEAGSVGDVPNDAWSMPPYFSPYRTSDSGRGWSASDLVAKRRPVSAGHSQMHGQRSAQVHAQMPVGTFYDAPSMGTSAGGAGHYGASYGMANEPLVDSNFYNASDVSRHAHNPMMPGGHHDIAMHGGKYELAAHSGQYSEETAPVGAIYTDNHFPGTLSQADLQDMGGRGVMRVADWQWPQQ